MQGVPLSDEWFSVFDSAQLVCELEGFVTGECVHAWVSVSVRAGGSVGY